MKAHIKLQVIVGLCAAVMLLMASPVLAADELADRGYVADYLTNAAKPYNPQVQRTHIIKGYEDGQLHEEQAVTRAEALVMLERAFGELPAPQGHNKRVAIPKSDFKDIPDWAQDELANVFDAGIVAGTDKSVFSPEQPVTKGQLEIFCRRVYALLGSNEKDNFYAAVNKETLDNMEIKQGWADSGVFNDLTIQAMADVNEIFREIVEHGGYAKGTPEQKIADYYKCIMDKEGRAAIGMAPLIPYFEELDKIKSIDELNNFQNKVMKNLYTPLFGEVSISVDMKDSTKYLPEYAAASPMHPKEFYTEGTEQQHKRYINYIKSKLLAGGEAEGTAENHAQAFYKFEQKMSAASLNPQDSLNADKTYNTFTCGELQSKAGGVDMAGLLQSGGWRQTGRILVKDVGLLTKFAKFFRTENLETLKTIAKLALLDSWGTSLDDGFTKTVMDYNQEYMGIESGYSDEEMATLMMQNAMSDYIGKIYVEKHFDRETKQDVTKMIKDIIAVYERRIDALTWMSADTKAKAKAKLNAITIKVGYPDDWSSYLDNAEITPVGEGGSYFSNKLAIRKAKMEHDAALQGAAVDKKKWDMCTFDVNAGYGITANDITFPAAILQAPIYDVNASYEENLGSLGFIIAHEITHAFDGSGAKFDENGNAADWWTAEDYRQFRSLCKDMIAFYDGQEAAPGIRVNGALTLDENIADQGAAACITEIAAALPNPDFRAMYRAMAKCFASSCSRESYQYQVQTDVHSPDNIRINRAVANCEQFYKAFGITEQDGMYVAPEHRVKIW